MKNTAILIPAVWMVLLTALVWCWMYYTRISEMFRKGIKTQTLADGDKAAVLLKNVVNPSDNLENLFEIPILFYLAVAFIFALGLTSPFFVYLAYAFVILRAIHSIIHCTYNRVIQRFSAYFVSTMILWVMWFKLGLRILSL